MNYEAVSDAEVTYRRHREEARKMYGEGWERLSLSEQARWVNRAVLDGKRNESILASHIAAALDFADGLSFAGMNDAAENQRVALVKTLTKALQDAGRQDLVDLALHAEG